jgi:hypothetical protein
MCPVCTTRSNAHEFHREPDTEVKCSIGWKLFGVYKQGYFMYGISRVWIVLRPRPGTAARNILVRVVLYGRNLVK